MSSVNTYHFRNYSTLNLIANHNPNLSPALSTQDTSGKLNGLNAHANSIRDSFRSKDKYASRAKVVIKAQAIVHINSTISNTIISVTDRNGNVKVRKSAGACGFVASRRSTRHAAQVVGVDVGRETVRKGIRVVLVKVKGIGYGKQSSIKGLFKGGLKIIRVRDITSIPFNGCRPPIPKRKSSN